jgi:membrane protease YdiL (CAAX protease family)
VLFATMLLAGVAGLGLDLAGLPGPLLVLVTYALIFGGWFLWCLRVAAPHGGLVRGLGAPSLRRWRWPDVGWGGVTWICVFGISAAVGLLVIALGIPRAANGAEVADLSGATQAAFAVAALVGAPIVEELLFRGVMLRSLTRRIGMRPAVVAQGVLFGAYHMTPAYGWGNVGLVLQLGAVGVMLGVWTVQRDGRLLPAMVAHCILNLLAVTLLVWGPDLAAT